MKESIMAQFETATKAAYAERNTVLSAIQAVEKLNEDNSEIVNALMHELAAYDQSTQATLNADPLAAEEKEVAFANWFQDGFDAAYEYLLA